MHARWRGVSLVTNRDENKTLGEPRLSMAPAASLNQRPSDIRFWPRSRSGPLQQEQITTPALKLFLQIGACHRA